MTEEPKATMVSATPVGDNGGVKTHEMPVFSPQRISAELTDFYHGFRMTPGDWGSLTQLFFDNLSTLLGAVFAIQNIRTFALPTDITPEIDNVVWGKIVPGVGFTLCLGNVYYSWMAVRLTKKYGRPYTAQPYGLNTPQAFAFVFNVMCTFQNLRSVTPYSYWNKIHSQIAICFVSYRPRVFFIGRNGRPSKSFRCGIPRGFSGELYHRFDFNGVGYVWTANLEVRPGVRIAGPHCWYRYRIFRIRTVDE